MDEKEQIFNKFRTWGYLQASLDPLGFFKPLEVPGLNIDNDYADKAHRFYCRSIGAEFMFIPDPVRRKWIQDNLESNFLPKNQKDILRLLVSAEIFEQVLQTRYIGTKRFSLEGLISLIPLLDRMISDSIEKETSEVVIGMSHRGRLNVLVHSVGVSPVDIFTKFEDVDPLSVLGSGDVKYHIGATGIYKTREGIETNVRLVSNPSHLEVVDPVALGRVKAKQRRAGQNGYKKFLPVLIHGDAAFAGQGVLAETLNLATLEGYNVGGTIHIICNNLIGFTTKPAELHSSLFASDVAKRIPIPIFHVNAEDVDAVIKVGKIALEYRYKFSSDVVIDLIGYRKHGHSEVDDPTITHPVLYSKIISHPSVSKIYSTKIEVDTTDLIQEYLDKFDEAQKKAITKRKNPVISKLPDYWSGYHGGVYKKEYEVNTSVSTESIADITKILTALPENFNINPKIKKLLEQRQKMGEGKTPVDFGMAEALAFGSLLKEGISVRMSGQDSIRGTFAHRNAALIDIKNEQEFFPLKQLEKENVWFGIYNSPLSEASVLGFEYGFSRDYPDALVLWEAQFGDFQNGAQIIIDQFISSGEDKWGLLSGLVMLLPHGYEGQGPDHSNARIDRYLLSAGEFNYQVYQPSTAAQYFHLLRKQALRKWRKPLIVFTPKSLLRNPSAFSSLDKFTSSGFQNVLPLNDAEQPGRIIFCSGKIGHEILREIHRKKVNDVVVITIEQLYPFPEEEIKIQLERFKNDSEIVWVQEEPANMGPMTYVLPKLELIAGNRFIQSVKRSASASPATGSQKAHEQEQKVILELSLKRQSAASQ